MRCTKAGISLVNFELATTRCAPALRAFERASKSMCEPKASTLRPAFGPCEWLFPSQLQL